MRTTPLPSTGWRLTDVEGLSPCSQRALLRAFGLRRWEGVLGAIFSDLCFCEVDDPTHLEAAYRFASEHCGARIPLVLYCGPSPRIYGDLGDLGAMAAWYFRAVERLHG